MKKASGKENWDKKRIVKVFGLSHVLRQGFTKMQVMLGENSEKKIRLMGEEWLSVALEALRGYRFSSD